MKKKTQSDMLPIAPLMIEHRLIERMVALFEKELNAISQKSQVNADFLTQAVDFYIVYADNCHHGKEEEILFAQLKTKKLSPPHAQTLDNLIEDHARGRALINALAASLKNVRLTDSLRRLKSIEATIGDLVKLYKEHIRKEDKEFFIPAMKYFTKQEQDAMLAEFWEFDRNLIHEKYRKLLEELEK
ncbi:MAG: hemerythrin domain-containing protein [Candidatus Omnitrophica bacterium]|nr:hemerythrin domain-containing protein [Candidatus Omnitrophota bacterium]